MNELTRTAYLEAMGLDSYVSRRQLPGAAVTSRLAVLRRTPAAPVAAAMPLADMQNQLGTGRRRGARPAAPSRESAPPDANLPRFSLSAIVAGNWLWLEDLGEMPLAVEQVRLVEAMALALNCAAGDTQAAVDKPEVTLFDWPIHTNRQLDLGEEAARAAVTGFVGRKLDECNCVGLVLLGQACAGRVPVGEIGVRAVQTRSSQEILSSPELKQQVWRDLQPLLNPA